MLRFLAFVIPIISLIGGIPLRLGLVPPNRWFGYRTALTSKDPAVWYAVNRELGLALVIAGALGLVLTLLLLRAVQGWKLETRLLTSIIGNGVIVLIALLVVVLRVQRL